MPFSATAARVLMHLRGYPASIANIQSFLDTVPHNYPFSDNRTLRDQTIRLAAALEVWRNNSCQIGEDWRGNTLMDTDIPSNVLDVAQREHVSPIATMVLRTFIEFYQAWLPGWEEPPHEIESYCPPLSTWRLAGHWLFATSEEAHSPPEPDPEPPPPNRMEMLLGEEE